MAAGSSILGVLFSLVGSKTTLFCFSIAIAVMLVLFLGYILMTNDQEHWYYIVSGSEKECDMENDQWLHAWGLLIQNYVTYAEV